MGKFRAVTYICENKHILKLMEKKPCPLCGSQIKRYRQNDYDAKAKALKELNKMAREMLGS